MSGSACATGWRKAKPHTTSTPQSSKEPSSRAHALWAKRSRVVKNRRVERETHRHHSKIERDKYDQRVKDPPRDRFFLQPRKERSELNSSRRRTNIFRSGTCQLDKSNGSRHGVKPHRSNRELQPLPRMAKWSSTRRLPRQSNRPQKSKGYSSSNHNTCEPSIRSSPARSTIPPPKATRAMPVINKRNSLSTVAMFCKTSTFRSPLARI